MDTATSYLSILLNDIEQLKNLLASYNNVLINLKSKYNVIDDDIKLGKLMGEQERQVLLQTIGMFRAYSTRIYIAYNSIKSKFVSLSDETKNSITKNYKIITNNAVPEYETSEEFVQAISDLFVNEINIQSLINSSNKTQTLAESSVAPSYEE